MNLISKFDLFSIEFMTKYHDLLKIYDEMIEN